MKKKFIAIAILAMFVAPLKVKSETVDFYVNRGQQRYTKKDYYGCISDFTKAINLQVSSNYSSYAYRRRGHCKFFLNDFSGSLADFNQSIGIDPNNIFTYQFRGDTKQEMGDHYGAISDYTRAIKMNPNKDYSYFFRGISKLKIGDLEGACSDWRKASSFGDGLAAKSLKEHCHTGQ